MGVMALALLAGAAALMISRSISPNKPTYVVRPATAPATQLAARAPASLTRPAPEPVRTLLDVIHRHQPGYATTQPLPAYEALPFPATPNECGHFILREPVYLDAAANLWITHPDADDTPTVLKRAADESTHVTRERIVFVHRIFDEAGGVRMVLICPASGPEPVPNSYEAVDAKGRTPMRGTRNGYDWARAFSWNNRIVVPTEAGVSIWSFDPNVSELASPPLADGSAPRAAVELAADSDQVLAWIPPGNGLQPSLGALWFTNKGWAPLGKAQNWPSAIVDLFLLDDGSVLQLVPDSSPDDDSDASANPDNLGDLPAQAPPTTDDIKVKLALASLAPTHLDEAKAIKLIDQLASDSEAKREAAYAELTKLGAGLWPILERELEKAPDPHSRQTIRQLLRNKLAPTLGGMGLVDGHLRRIVRQADGMALYYADGGVSSPQNDGDDLIVAPAFLSHPALQPTHNAPGALFGTLSQAMAKHLDPPHCVFTAIGNEWFVGDAVRGPGRYADVDFIPLLPKSEHVFYKVVGIDATGRYLFRKPPVGAAATNPATHPAVMREPGDDVVETLIVDPRLPDPTPRLPVWDVAMDQASAGWTADNWPALKNGGAWTLREFGTQVLDETKEKMLTEPGDVPPAPTVTESPPATRVATSAPATTHPATTQAAATAPALPAGPPLLVDAQGNRYYDGLTTLTVVDRAGQQTIWPLPARATGDKVLALLKVKDGRLFLFNQPGRAVAIRPTPGGDEPFSLQALFSKHIPAIDAPTRIWLDPAGRIDIVYDGNKLTVLFPEGRIPKDIATMIPAGAVGEDGE
jgi:hypothetical protein